MRNLIALFTAASALGFSVPAAAADTVYMGSQTGGASTATYSAVSYTITTNGQLGVLSLQDLVRATFTFFNSSGSQTFFYDPAGGSPGDLRVDGTSLEATGTSLYFVFSASGNNTFTFSDPTGSNSFCFSSELLCGTVAGEGGSFTIKTPGRALTGYNTGYDAPGVPRTIATLMPSVPEPATWAMMLLGFGGIGLAMRRRRPALA